MNVDLIMAPQTDSALAAKNVTQTIPIIFGTQMRSIFSLGSYSYLFSLGKYRRNR